MTAKPTLTVASADDVLEAAHLRASWRRPPLPVIVAVAAVAACVYGVLYATIVDTIMRVLPGLWLIQQAPDGLGLAVACIVARDAAGDVALTVLVVGTGVAVGRGLWRGSVATRAFAVCLLILAVVTADRGAPWRLAGLLVVATVGIVALLWPAARRHFGARARQGLRRCRSALWAGALTGYLVFGQIIGRPMLAPLERWLVRTDGSVVLDVRSRILAGVAADDELLGTLTLRVGEDVEWEPSPSLVASLVPGILTDYTLAVLTRLSVLVGIATALLTAAPVVMHVAGRFTRRWAVRGADSSRRGDVTRWELATAGWRGLFVHGWARGSRPDAAAVIGAATHAVGWLPLHQLPPRRATPLVVSRLVAGACRGVAVGAVVVVAEAGQFTIGRLATLYELLQDSTLFLSSLNARMDLDPALQWQTQATFALGAANVRRAATTSAIGLTALLVAVLVAAAEMRKRRTAVAVDVVVSWRETVLEVVAEPTTTLVLTPDGETTEHRWTRWRAEPRERLVRLPGLHVVSDVRATERGWEGRITTPQRRLLGWLPLTGIDTVDIQETRSEPAAAGQSWDTVVLLRDGHRAMLLRRLSIAAMGVMVGAGPVLPPPLRLLVYGLLIPVPAVAAWRPLTAVRLLQAGARRLNQRRSARTPAPATDRGERSSPH